MKEKAKIGWLNAGPQMDLKTHEENVINELKKADFTQAELNNDLLPDHYIITAS